MNVNFAASIYYPFLGRLIDGEYSSQGINLIWHHVSPPDALFRQIIESERYDVSEMSLSSYTMLRQEGWTNYIALPIFTSRCFRHSSLLVRSDSEITDGAQLKGKRVGVPEYHMTSAVWARGFLQEDCGVDPGAVYWFTGGLERPGRHERVKLPARISSRVAAIGADETLFGMLLEGRLDAVISPHSPSLLRENPPPLRRLFLDCPRVEKDYYRAHGVFPMNHTVVLRRRLYESSPNLAHQVFRALKELKEEFYARVRLLQNTSVFPWFYKYLDEVVEVLGHDLWPYGLERNRLALEKFFDYALKQDLIEKEPELKDLFVDLND